MKKSVIISGNEIEYIKSENLLQDAQIIIDTARDYAYKAVNFALVKRNWLLGKRIAEEELAGEERAEYGSKIICNLADKLTELYGKGFDRSTLYKFLRFYKYFPQIVDSASPQLERLSWTHFRILLQVNDETARQWYAAEAAAEAWSVKTLQRNISSQYYYRLLQTNTPDAVKAEMETLTADYQTDKLEFIKNPVVAEFLGMSQNCDYLETQLESCIINNLQKFLMELGKGYAFVARQKRIVTEKNTYSIDLVFYNYILKCFVLIDLKIGTVTHQDVGQMDMYVRMYDELKKSSDDNPTIGIILCSDTDEDIARFSMLKGNEQLFTTKYKTYLPSEEELCAEIKKQKELFYLQHSSLNESEEM